jgi:MoaA/NifB/PqqE/SkfB family radical SAM enzyme
VVEAVVEGVEMVEKSEKGKQFTITLSQKAYEDLSAVAEWKGMSFALYIRMVCEGHHENPGVQRNVERAKADLEQKKRKG